MRRSRVILVAAGVVLATAVGLAQNLLSSVVPDSWIARHTTLLAMSVLGLTAAAAAVGVSLDLAGAHRPSTLHPGHDELLAEVRRNLLDELTRAEAAVGLGNGVPLSVRWSNSMPDLHSDWREICGPGNRVRVIRLDGRFDDIARTYLKVPSRRLVILGRAGSGKSVVAMRLARSLLESRRGPSIVPILLRAQHWPEGTDLRGWLTQELLRRTHASDPAWARALAASRNLVLILDGFDEMARRHQADILAGLTSATCLVLVSREDEYREACREHGVLPSSAAITLHDLEPPEAVAFLRSRARRRATGNGEVRTAWDDFPNTGGMLRTPLIVAMADVVYNAPDRKPAELKDRDRFPTTEAVEEYLLGALLERGYLPHGSRRSRRDPGWVSRWTAAEGRYWHERLAVLLVTGRRETISPWHLSVHHDSPQFVSGAPIIAAVMTPVVITGGVDATPLFVGFAALVFGVFYTSRNDGGDISLRALFRRDRPPRVPDPGRQTRNRLYRSVALGLSIGFVVAAALFLSISGPKALLSLAVTWAQMTLLAVLVASAATLRSGLAVQRGPAGGFRPSIRRMRRVSVTETLIFTLTVAIPVAAFSLAGADTGDRRQVAGNAALVFTSMFVVWQQTTWGRWITARLFLTVRGDIPPRLFTFWRDADRVGVLRQDGDAYVFRHHLLLEHCAASALSDLPARRVEDGDLRSLIYMRAVHRRTTWALDGLAEIVAERRQAHGEWHHKTFGARLELAMSRFSVDRSGAAAEEIRRIIADADDHLPPSKDVSNANFWAFAANALYTIGDTDAAASRYILAAHLLATLKIRGIPAGSLFRDEAEYFLRAARVLEEAESPVQAAKEN